MTLTVPPPVQRDSDPADGDETLREEAIKNLKRRRRFRENLATYLVVNGLLWLIWALTDRTADASMPWPAWVSAIWGFFLLLDAWKAFGRPALRRPIGEAEIEREIARLRSR